MPDWKEFRDIFAFSVPGCDQERFWRPRLDIGWEQTWNWPVFVPGPWLGDSVGLVEDNRGADHHNDGIGPWLHGVLPELLDLAIN